MSVRNTSPHEMFVRMANEHVPQYHFAAHPQDFAAWKSEALPKVMATLGDWPGRVPLNPEMIVEWEHSGLRMQKWIIDVGPHISATMLVNIPKDIAPAKSAQRSFAGTDMAPMAKTR